MTKKAGRPKTPPDKARAPGISIRLTAEESKVIFDAASRSHVKRKSDWARKALLYVAEHDIGVT